VHTQLRFLRHSGRQAAAGRRRRTRTRGSCRAGARPEVCGHYVGPDEGAGHFARTIRAVYEAIPGVQVEVLTPDFHARRELIAKIVEARPTVFNHNLETVERLQKAVRPQAGYERSLKVIETIKNLAPAMTAKSGMMLGLGESMDEVRAAARDLRHAGCDILTLGQYLPPGKDHLKVAEYIAPERFAELAQEFRALGFREVFAGPYVRSSYHAGETYIKSL
jgi:lipoyl synthase